VSNDFLETLGRTKAPLFGRFSFFLSLLGHAAGLGLTALVSIVSVGGPSVPSDRPIVDVLTIVHAAPAPGPPLPRRGVGSLRSVHEGSNSASESPSPKAQTLDKEHPETVEPAADPTPGAEVGPGIPAGDKTGKEGGDPSGTPDGQPGGCPGCQGPGPVVDYDQPARALFQPPPRYPEDAVRQRVEGTVILEILIEASGSVGGVRILQSIPLLDEAAVQAVRRWKFSPARKHGQAVPSLAKAPLRFRIF